MELNVVFRALVDTLERGLNNSDAICNFEEMEGDELAGTAVLKLRENCPKSRAAYNIRALLAVQGYARSALDNCKRLDDKNMCSYYFARRSS